MKKLIHNPDLGLLIFRLFIGLTMALAHGMGKMPPSDKLIAGVEAVGFPMPVVFAWCAALAELLGGFLIAVGLFTRPAAFFIGFTMLVAAFGVHATDGFSTREMALLYLVSCLLLVFQGAGRFSLDRIIRKV